MKLTEIDKNIKSKEIDMIVWRNFSYNELIPSYKEKSILFNTYYQETRYTCRENYIHQQKKSLATIYINVNVFEE